MFVNKVLLTLLGHDRMLSVIGEMFCPGGGFCPSLCLGGSVLTGIMSGGGGSVILSSWVVTCNILTNSRTFLTEKIMGTKIYILLLIFFTMRSLGANFAFLDETKIFSHNVPTAKS